MEWIVSSVYLTLLLLTLASSFNGNLAEKVEMRIVDEPTSYSWQNQNSPNEDRLKMRVDPSPFSGPEHLRRLNKKCFKKTIENSFNLKMYEFQFCPFSNVTQKEVETTAWNPYEGILGVWQEWNIKDNKFVSMSMLMGEQCGAKPRQTEVIFECGKTHEIANVTEPSHCEYEVIFHTPLVCHKHSMLVYPALEQEYRSRWDQLKYELEAEDITEKGYKIELNKIFQDAGLRLISDGDHSSSHGEKQSAHKTDGRFSNLDTCNEENDNLKKELEQTKEQLKRYL